MQARLIAWLVSIAAVLLALYGLYSYVWGLGAADVQAKWDKTKAEVVAEQLAKNAADSAKLRTLEGVKNENLAEIDRLRANNHALWLRLPKTACSGSGQAGGGTAAGTGELPTQGERDLAEAKRQLDDEAHRADQLVEQCRVLNDFVR